MLNRPGEGSVSDSRKREAVERSSVNHSWSSGREPTADLDSDIVTGFNNHVSAKAAHERLV
jgi:hypothetical protein